MTDLCLDFRGHIKVTSTIALHLTLNISETVYTDRLSSKGPPIENGIRAIERSRDRWRHVTLKGQTHDINTLRAQYLENAWRQRLLSKAPPIGNDI